MQTSSTLTPPMTDPLLPPEPPEEKDAKKREKEAKRLEAERGPLDPSFRYRAMQNAVEMTQDLIELADRKARFALVIISVLNAVALVVVAAESTVELSTETSGDREIEHRGVVRATA